MKKIISALAALAVGLGLAVVASPLAVSAHTKAASDTCEALSVDLQAYADIQPGKDATYKTVYQRYSYIGGGTEGPTTIPPSEEWQADEKKKPKDDPIGEAFQRGNGDNASWFFWTATQVEDEPAQDAKVNTVKVVIDGVPVEDSSFGRSFTKVYPFGDKTVAHDWTVTVTAWDDQRYSFTDSGTSEPCAPPVILPTCTTVTGSQVFSGPEYVGDALTLVTTEEEQGYWQAPFSGTLADIGTQLAVSADPASEVGLWIWVEDLNAWIVFEQGVYGDDLWSKTSIPGIPAGHGYAAAAQIEEYIALYGDSPAEAWLLYGTSEPGSTAVSSVTVGCTTYTFKYVPDVIVVTPPTPAWIDPCGVDNGYWSYENGEGYSFNALPTGELILTADEGYAFPEGTTTWWQESDSGELCPDVVIEAQPDEPTFHDQCGVDDDVLFVPEGTEQFAYEVDDQRVDGIGTVTVTAVPVEGYVFAEGTVTEWSHDYTSEACPVPTTPKQELAQTGVNPDEWLMWGVIGALAVLAGIVFTVNHLRRRNQQ